MGPGIPVIDMKLNHNLVSVKAIYKTIYTVAVHVDKEKTAHTHIEVGTSTHKDIYIKHQSGFFQLWLHNNNAYICFQWGNDEYF